MLDDLVEEVLRDEPLALQAALHVGQREQDRVDPLALDRGAELVEREAGPCRPGTLHGGGSGNDAQARAIVSCQPGSPTTASSASTTFGSNWVPEQRRSSATASSIGIAAR